MRSRKLQTFFLILLIVLLSAATIWVRTSTVNNTYYYVKQELELKKTEKEVQESRVRWLRLTSPAELEKIASPLGLKAPSVKQLLRYKKEPGEQKLAKQ